MSEQDLIRKYKEKLSGQLDIQGSMPSSSLYSREYDIFRKELLSPQLSFYEKLCSFSESALKMKVNPELHFKLLDSINACHLQITPSGVLSASFFFPVIFIILSVFLSLLVLNSVFFTLLGLFAGIAAIFVLQKLPDFLANSWRMKSSNQMVLCVFYIVTYMRHTSNLELAIEFASAHLSPPLSLDLRKILWDVESGKFESVKESLESYLAGWRKYNSEFVESFNLIESSLYEPSDDRRLSLLEKALDVILEQTYEKMLHYAQNLKGPINMLHMLGIVMPVLGLVILPLMVSFMEGIAWYHIAAFYNVILPVIVYVLGRSILSKRPTGYGDTDVSEINPALKKFRNVVFSIGSLEFVISPVFISLTLGLFAFFIALLPLILHSFAPDYDFAVKGLEFLGYRESSVLKGVIIGPFGLGAALLSLFFPLCLALSIGLYFKLRSSNVIKIRDEAKKLEDEFSSALIQLGNRLGDGLPAEVAFPKVADVLEDTSSGRFFRLVSSNISKLGMSVREAIFNPEQGALSAFPSAVIQSSMKVLIESIKKGPLIAASALLNVARYIKEIHKVNERLKDLMADIISDMKSQIAFLTPAISGIVIGITSMITFILGSLSGSIQKIGTEQAGDQLGTLMNLFGDGMPTYYFQAVVGIYVFQIVYILTILSNGIENGADKLNERYSLGNNLIKSTLTYCIIAAIVMIIFNVIAANIIGNIVFVE